MRQLRKHWQVPAGALAVLVLGGTVWWRGAEARTTAFFSLLQASGTATTYEPITQLRRDAILQILADVNLDRDAFVALNVSDAQAESVLSTVRNWQSSNEALLASLNNAIHQKVAAVYSFEQAMAMGPADSSREPALALARQDLKDARAAYRSSLVSLESSINALLSESQRATWTAIRTGHGQHMPIRMLALSDEQRLAVSDAEHRYQRQHAAAGSNDERAATVTARQNALDQILTTDQKTMVARYQSYYVASSTAVAGALNTVLAVEPS